MTNEHILESAKRYAQEEPDLYGQTQVNQWVTRAENGDEEALEELRSRFASTLEFGTAGLRGKMEPGTARMNRVMVMRASWG